jgi:hypothetical protein
METKWKYFGPDAFGGFEDVPSCADASYRDDDAPRPEPEVIEPESPGDAKDCGAASYTSSTRMSAGLASITETVVERQGVRERTRVSVIRFCRSEITSEQSQHWPRP